MKSLILTVILFLFPVSTQAGFPEGENGYDLKKIEESFRLPCDEIGNDDCFQLTKGLPMGTSFELSTLVYLEAVIGEVIFDKNLTEDGMRSIHANLE